MTEPQPDALDHAGIYYIRVLAALHRQLQPAWYLEIGAEAGKCLKPVRCNTVCVDPHIQIEPRFLADIPQIFMFQTTSDEFFSTDFLATNRIVFDMAFLDGMHLFEFLLRDFINTERHCHKDSIVLMHDCLPNNTEMTERTPDPESRTDKVKAKWWTGDVWKVVRILQTYRPDLSVTALDCPPTGLVVVRRLDPASRVLSESYDEIVEAYGPLDLREYGFDRFYREASVVSSKAFVAPSSLGHLIGDSRTTSPEPADGR